MPSILVVDRDERVPKRVRQALGAEGWTVTHARDVTAALQSAGSEAPDLFLVSSEIPGAGNLLATFARRQGGPGALALVPDSAGAAGEVGGARAAGGLGEDGVVARSFDEAQLRVAVDRILKTPDRPTEPRSDEPKLTSHDIFGDLVAEVERETGVREPVRPRASPQQGASPPGAAAAQGSGAPPRRRPVDDDIERKLEQTLSGVLGTGQGARRPAAPGSATPPPREARSPAVPASRGSDDVEKLLSATLSGLDLTGSASRKRPAASEARPARQDPRPPRPEPQPPRQGPPSAPPKPPSVPPARKPERPSFDLSDFEALVDRSKRGREAARPVRPEPPSATPPERPPLQLSSLFSETMREVPEAEAEERLEGQAADAPAPAGEGKRFGQYHLLDRIGVGGMAEVWKARMRGVEGFQKTVAIKRILPHLTDSTDFVDMFVDEAKLAAQLNHANIIHIYDLGKLGDDYYIAMEYVEGENLRAILNRARERTELLPPGLALHVGARLASALAYAHRKRDFEDRELGLVHRDVSPQNVLVGYEGTIKLCDFGIVKAVSKSSHTQMGALKGKLQYMSPEQAWGRPVDGRSDIFSLGSLLFEMLTGRRLFVGESEMEVLEAVRECRVQAPSELVPGLDPAIDEAVLKALAQDPQDRFQTAGELERRLETLLGSVRPTPGQGELAAFVARLFDREPGVEVPAVVPAEEAAPLRPAPPMVPPAPAEEAPEPPAAGPPPPAPAPSPATETDASEPPPAEADASEPPAPEAPAAGEVPVDAVAAVREVEPEEGGGRGKGLLVAAIVLALVLGALLAWYLVQRGGAGEAEGAPEAPPPAAVEEPVAPAPDEPGTGRAPGDGVMGAGGDEAAEAAAPDEAAEAGAAAASPDDLDRVLEEELARREEELARREELLRRQFEEEERRLQRQLEALEERARQEAQAPEAPAPEPRGSAAGAETPSESAPPPPPPSAPASVARARGSPAVIRTTPAAAPVPASRPAGERSPPSPPRPPAPSPAPPPEPASPAPVPRPAVREGDLVSMGPGVGPPKLVRFEKPEYPPVARRLRVQGVVVVSVLIGETGAVLEARLVQGTGRDVGLEEAALAAARSARYEPATKDGVRVKMWTTLRIPFKL